MAWEDIRLICYDYTLVGLKTIFEVRNQGATDPFGFIYVSGAATERDQTRTPSVMPQYLLMRGDLAVKILDFATEHKGEMEACIIRPGKINSPGLNIGTAVSAVVQAGDWGSVLVDQLSAVLINEALNGFEKDTIENAELMESGQQVLKKTSMV